MFRARDEQMANVIHDARPASIFGKIFLQLLFRLRSAVVGILGHVGTEVGVQAGSRPFSMKRGLHEVSDQQIVKYLVAHRGHERMTRRFKGDTAIEPSFFELNDGVLSSNPDRNKIQASIEVRDRMEIISHVGRIVLFKLIRPIVAEIFWGKLPGCRFSGFEFGIAIVIAPIANKGWKKF
jgi:hypothetical protein